MADEELIARYSPILLYEEIAGILCKQTPAGVHPELGMVTYIRDVALRIQEWTTGHLSVIAKCNWESGRSAANATAAVLAVATLILGNVLKSSE